ncbi:PA14 domain-containing protein [[Flexibacter] sp. ATCC 35208]|uniref:PA14 domain-containing protein n=1 Tax=[Flexibacter] sp. ATCC 35208 TaxID=1936242 RepID=UPI0009CCFCD4|nr:PA14 domain-containing protein [[Flexibacter] sp. ATCC 35208]OMP74649.1 hypothetical protein BW716_34255 [[Flexibacter] sp. ATCC 35208]
MILDLAAKGKKAFAITMLALLYIQTVIPAYSLAAAKSFPMKGINGVVVNPSIHKVPAIYKAVTPGTYKDFPPGTNNGLLPVTNNVSTTATARIGGPGQPEMQAFTSVSSDNMVDLFSGDFSYSIPLLDVGGYPIALGYNSGISMDQEPSWVGLGWNINPGTITRNLRGIPDDFDGKDSIRKVQYIKPTQTWGVNLEVGYELFGKPSETAQSSDSSIGTISFGLGFTHNNYKGYGIESSLSAGLNAGSKTFPGLSGGLSLTNSSTDGLTAGVSLFESVSAKDGDLESKSASTSASVSASYNTRAGLKDLQLSVGTRLYQVMQKSKVDANYRNPSSSGVFGTSISFAKPAYMPTITMPYTGSAYSFSAKIGTTTIAYHPFIKGEYSHSKQYIADEDTSLSLPAFGYLNYQDANEKPASLLDYNIEKEMPYREKPAIPTIGIPAYTYDVFSITGEGTGGMFRAYRGDIGYVYDHQMKTKDGSTSGNVDLGFGQSFHWGGDFNLVRASTEVNPWTARNYMALEVPFKSSTGLYEAAYFRNPGETTVNDKDWYDALGGDEVVTTRLQHLSSSSARMYALNILDRYKAFSKDSFVTVTSETAGRMKRDKRTQVISYLTAEEATTAGLSQYIDNYAVNTFPLQSCDVTYPSDLTDSMQGLRGDYYSGRNFKSFLFSRTDTVVNFANLTEINVNKPEGISTIRHNFSVRWTGRLKTDVTGRYVVSTRSDDGIRLYINDSLVFQRWTDHPDSKADSAVLNLVAGETYTIKMEYYQKDERGVAKLQWKYAGLPNQFVPKPNLYLTPAKDTFQIEDGAIAREKRVNTFRKSNHFSEIDVLNADGRRYIYGIPVYNFLQKDVSFSVNTDSGSIAEGLVGYIPGKDNTTANRNGIDNYLSKEETPAYPHSFLLTGILSPDYVDLTGDGITPDDRGDAIKFNYSKMADKNNPERWRTPYSKKATYNPNLLTDNRDDKGSYVYGEKELWYLNSIESKNMIATFWVSNREDMPGMDEDGNLQAIGQHKKLDSIKVYSKSDFLSYGTKALAIKTVHFQYSYSLCKGVNASEPTKGKLTLEKVWFTYNGNQRADKNAYVFGYNSNNPTYATKNYDRWGNYKDAAQNPGSLNNAEYPYALQDSTLAAQNMAAWTLDRIKLPSGATMKVDYESDDYAYVQNRRAAQMFHVAGVYTGIPSQANLTTNLYSSSSTSNEHLYVGVNVPKAITDEEVYTRYLEGMDTLFFKMFVKMPTDKFGSGGEYVNCYATLDPGNYGTFNDGNSIWFKLQAINSSGEVSSGGYSPLAKAAMQFLRLNLSSKAYPGSETSDDLTPLDGAKMLLSQVTNLTEMITGFDKSARIKGWAKTFDTTRSFVRLANPYYKKYGGGLRVKRISIYDNWDAMTSQKQAVYGQEYTYTTTKDSLTISSGVAIWEPTIGGEENPWRLPIQYKQQSAVLAPVSSGYVERPLGETFFPGPSVGYSRVKVRSINTKLKRSANGYSETCFYTSYDFPTITDMTPLGDNKKRFKPTLANLLRINARHYMAVSQGFKVELNDMNGKIKSQSLFGEADSTNAITSTHYHYHTDDATATFKHLNNTVKVISAEGVIDTAATVGKDVELMMSMREQRSVTQSFNLNINSDGFLVGTFWAIIPSLLNIAQREEVIFRVAGTMKVVNRHGLLDSVVAIDKGSRVVTRNMLYDGESGSVVLTSTQNEFNDPIYNFSLPAGWIYDGMSGAYKNIGATADNVTIKEGKIISGLDSAMVVSYFSAGDEILVYTRQKTGGTDCEPEIATWPALSRLYAVDANAISGGDPAIYFVDKDGAPFTGTEVTMKVTRSGRRNLSVSAGEVAMLENPISSGTSLVIDENSRVLAASATEYSQFWKVTDVKKVDSVTSCIQQTYADYNSGCGLHVYGNDSIGGYYTIECTSGSADPVYYSIPRDQYSSTVSQAAANALAQAALDSIGPIYAAMNSTCVETCNLTAYKKDDSEDLPSFEVIAINNETGVSYQVGGGEQVTQFPVCKAIPEGSYTVRMAAMETCYAYSADSTEYELSDDTYQTFQSSTPINVLLSRNKRKYNTSFSVSVSKNDCDSGYVGSSVSVTIAAGLYYSYVSVADANNKAAAAVDTSSLQTQANNSGTCLDATHLIVKAKDGYSPSPVEVTYATDAGFSNTVQLFAMVDSIYTTISSAMWNITFNPQTTSYTYHISINGGDTQTFTTATTYHISGPPLTIEIW